jgi:SAM-dependent methyltransferase
MGVPRFRYIPDVVTNKYRGLAATHPSMLPLHVLLQKLVIFDFVAPVVAQHPHETLLEIGAGLGIHSALLSRFGAVSATELAVPGSFVGADGDVAGIRDTVIREFSEHPVSFANNDGKRLPYGDDSFDIVFHNSVIEHVPDIAAFNREVRRVLRPGGICICITGTPALCRFRLVKDWFLKLPLLAAIALVREMPLLRELTLGLLRVIGASDGSRQKIRERLQRVDDRLRAVSGRASSLPGQADGCLGNSMSAFHARLYHYLYFPDYNRILGEELAREAGLSLDALFVCLEQHFGSLLNRLRFAFTPRTHGQHYRNVRQEIREWHIERWQRQFVETGFRVEDIQGYRYHYLLELTPFSAWNAALYARAARFIHFAMERQMFDPACASEIIIIAQKEG